MVFKRGIILIAILCSLLYPPAAIPEETVRVLVMDGLPGMTLNFPAGYELAQATDMGTILTENGQAGLKITIDKDHGPPEGVRINAGNAAVNINEFALSGKIDIKRTGTGTYSIINELGLEDYTKSVVGEEMSSKWPVEALKAQAVIARTYALYKKKTCSGDYDVSATVSSQVFTGGAKEKEGPALAARLTRGEVLTYAGEIIDAVYHSTCGGQTEDSRDVWGRPFPYLKSRDCSYCQSSPYYVWNRSFSAAAIGKALGAVGLGVEGIKSIKVLERSPSMRIKRLRVIAASGYVTIKGEDFRRALGYSNLPSTCFEVRKDGDNFVFSGKGSGHGVGLCQVGAKVMAEQGKDYREILAFYYPGTVITKMPDEEKVSRCW